MIEVGDVVPLSFRVLNADGGLVDATVTFTVSQPVGADLSPVATRDDVGTYSAAFVATQPGRYVIRKSATGAFSKTELDVVNAGPAVGPVAIISLAEAKEQINIGADVHDDDEELRGFLSAASRVVERYTGRVIARRTIVEDHMLDGTGVVLLRSAPVVALTSVQSIDGAIFLTVPASAVDGEHGIVRLTASGPHRFTVVAGEAVVPEDTIKATQIICAHLWQTQRVQALGSSPGFGVDMPAPVTGRGYLIPNQAAQLLGGRAPNPP